ncbi:MAG: hypothetical protein GWN18_05255, partial [Thermoplasmata archaeon]|nr:hypothetical protein [Thermoplasmata archaeon]NIV35860.1 hypothetical protein [Anaerolineae bacterium]NIS12029.1 hypothetical protein [Thermoplasmata archaeon]NIS19381.1 hypothetical protein [Thermoplasmata archaeon]NIT76480.1 hypothetical protein [Thermoplasmata archaeon]
IDPDNAMPETPMENNMATSDVPLDVRQYNEGEPSDSPDEPESSALNLGFVAIMVAAIIFVVLIVVAVLVMRET